MYAVCHVSVKSISYSHPWFYSHLIFTFISYSHLIIGCLNMTSLLAMQVVLRFLRLTYTSVERTNFDQKDWKTLYCSDSDEAPHLTIGDQMERILVKLANNPSTFGNACLALRTRLFANEKEMFFAKRTPSGHMQIVHDKKWEECNNGSIPKHSGRMLRRGFSQLLFGLMELEHLKRAVSVCAEGQTKEQDIWIVGGCNVLGCLSSNKRTSLFKCFQKLRAEKEIESPLASLFKV